MCSLVTLKSLLLYTVRKCNFLGLSFHVNVRRQVNYVLKTIYSHFSQYANILFRNAFYGEITTNKASINRLLRKISVFPYKSCFIDKWQIDKSLT